MFKKNDFYDPSTAAYYDPEDDHKVAVVTGGTQGIGFYTILHLHLHGYVVYMLGRNEEKCLKAIEAIEETAAKRASEHKLGQINYIHLDLLQLKTVKKAADELKSKETQVDLLINNAGLMAVPYDVSEDGIEVQYQVNLVAHALLTLELIPLLEKPSKPRVVFVSSLAHTGVSSYRNPSEKVEGTPKVFYKVQRYGLAKLGQIHFAREAAKRFPKILFLAVHPGIIHTQLYSDIYDSLSWFAVIAKPFFRASTYFVAVSEETGSLSTLRAALDPTITSEKDNGKYYITGGVETSSSSLSKNEDYIKQTWDWNIKTLKEKGYFFPYVSGEA